MTRWNSDFVLGPTHFYCLHNHYQGIRKERELSRTTGHGDFADPIPGQEWSGVNVGRKLCTFSVK